MNICFLSLDYPSEKSTSGVGTLVQTLARSLVTQGHKVTVAALMNEGEPVLNDDAGVKVYRYQQGRWHRHPLKIKMPLVWRLSRPIRELERSWNGLKLIKELNAQEPFDLIEITE